jgi:magnesium-protoporphyrin O-methyltransferase
MPGSSYIERRGRLGEYFDKTAVDAWSRLTSDAPVSRIRATVRAGRDQMRNMLLSWLPEDMSGMRLLDAGCGTGALSLMAAARGAHVVAVDLAANLVDLARERAKGEPGADRISFEVGDFIDPAWGEFDYAVAMDSLIHYGGDDIAGALACLGGRMHRAMLITFAPRTPALSAMHLAGRLFPRADRAPAIQPISHDRVCRLIAAHPDLQGWDAARTHRVVSGFYTSQALELVRS